MSLKDVETIKNDPNNLKIANELVMVLQDLIRIPSPSGYESDIAEYLVRLGNNFHIGL